MQITFSNVCRYEYESEKKCDSHVDIFMKALTAAKTLPGQGFAAIKARIF